MSHHHHSFTLRSVQTLLHHCAEDHRHIHERINDSTDNEGARTGRDTIYRNHVERVLKAVADLYDFQQGIRMQAEAATEDKMDRLLISLVGERGPSDDEQTERP